jgi:hypothetical protein
MALQLSEEQADGQTGEYWRITQIIWQPSEVVTVSVELYKDSTARSGGKAAMARRSYQLSCSVADLEVNYVIEHCYDQLKLLADFSGATDV